MVLVFAFSLFSDSLSVLADPMTKVRCIGNIIDFCFQSINQSYSVIKNYKEFDTLQDCNAYKSGLKVTATTSNNNYLFDLETDL